jgi:hypothetical protein
MVILSPGCQYRKGKAYTWPGTGDSIQYFILDAGSGKHIGDKIVQLTQLHGGKGDSCQFIYLGEQEDILRNHSLLLFNSVLPDFKEDMLSKGFMGTFSTRQNITYLVVNQAEAEKYLTSSD